MNRVTSPSFFPLFVRTCVFLDSKVTILEIHPFPETYIAGILTSDVAVSSTVFRISVISYSFGSLGDYDVT